MAKFVYTGSQNYLHPRLLWTLVAGTMYQRRLRHGGRPTEQRAQETDNARPESVTEVAVNERIDTTVASSEPLRQRPKIALQETLLEAA